MQLGVERGLTVYGPQLVEGIGCSTALLVNHAAGRVMLRGPCRRVAGDGSAGWPQPAVRGWTSWMMQGDCGMGLRLVEVEVRTQALRWQRSLVRLWRSTIATSSSSGVHPAYLGSHHDDSDNGQHVGCRDSVPWAEDHQYVSFQRLVDERPDGCA